MEINPNMKFFLSMMKSRNNPQQMVINMLRQSAGDNPMAQNLLTLVQQGDTSNVEQIAKNMLSSQGFDFDKEFGEFQQMLKSL